MDNLHTTYQGHVVAKNCKYDATSVAIHTCQDCGTGLCSFCGYFEGDIHFCNECWAERQECQTGMCFNCGEDLEPVWENQGWDGIEGPRHDEIVGYKLCSCGAGGGH